MINWQLFFAIANKTYQALKGHYEAGADAQARKHFREAMVASVRQAANDVISTIITLRMAELKGRIEGHANTLNTYDPEESDGNSRLRELIDGTALTIGELGALIDLMHSERDLAFDAFAPYINLLHLRAQAMVERELQYGEPEIKDIGYSFENAIARAEILLLIRQFEIFKRFLPPQKEPYGADGSLFRYFYKKDGHKIIACDSNRDDPCSATIALNKWNQDREKTYERDDTVRAISDSQSGLNGFLEKVYPEQPPVTMWRRLRIGDIERGVLPPIGSRPGRVPR